MSGDVTRAVVAAELVPAEALAEMVKWKISPHVVEALRAVGDNPGLAAQLDTPEKVAKHLHDALESPTRYAGMEVDLDVQAAFMRSMHTGKLRRSGLEVIQQPYTVLSTGEYALLLPCDFDEEQLVAAGTTLSTARGEKPNRVRLKTPRRCQAAGSTSVFVICTVEEA